MAAATLLKALVGDEASEALFSDAADIAAMLEVEAALAAACAETGLIGMDAAARIEAACHTNRMRPCWRPAWRETAS